MDIEAYNREINWIKQELKNNQEQHKEIDTKVERLQKDLSEIKITLTEIKIAVKGNGIKGLTDRIEELERAPWSNGMDNLHNEINEIRKSISSIKRILWIAAGILLALFAGAGTYKFLALKLAGL